MSEAKYWGGTHRVHWRGGAGHGGSLDSLGPGEVEGVELMSGWLISYQGNYQRSMLLTSLLIRAVNFWAWGKHVGRSVLRVGCK